MQFSRITFPLARSWDRWHDVPLSMPGDEDISNHSITLDVQEWPNINTSKWRAWGFSKAEILRTPRQHFIFQPVKSTIVETSGDSPSYILEGRWYRVDSRLERSLEGMAWGVYILVILFFVGMLLAVRAGSGIVAVGMFLLMYASVEGFMPLVLSRVAADRRMDRVTIPWSSVSRAVYFKRYGVLFLEWSDETGEVAVAMRFQADGAGKIVDRLRKALGENAEYRELEDANPSAPPADAS